MSAIKPDSPSYFRVIAALLIGFSLFYFADTCLRASEKYFWFDELCTVYICRLPTMHAVWQAVLHGADYNPPLFYVFTRAANAVFGEGLIATRLPSLLGFWVLCLCLFRFVHRRVGLLPGWVAMVFPLLTSAFFYAYEARPHGIVLGFCGLALVFWQMWGEEPRRICCLVAFSIALGAAFFTHCYAVLIAVPFAIAELSHTVRLRYIRWSFWTALIVPGIAAGLSFLPLLRSYKAATAGTIFADLFRASFHQLPGFYLILLSPGIFVVLIALFLFAINRSSFTEQLKTPELVLMLSFIALPVFGVLLGKAVHGPFIPRYFMSSVAGFSLLLGLGAGLRKPWNSAAILLAVVVTFGAGQSFAKLVWHRAHGVGEVLEEPSSKAMMNTAPGHPLASYSLLTKAAADSSLPIVVVEPMEFLYLVHYDPAWESRFFSVSWSKDDLFYRLYRNVREWCPVKYNQELTFDEFLPRNPHFFVFGGTGYAYELQNIMKRGGSVKSLWFGGGKFLAEIMMNR